MEWGGANYNDIDYIMYEKGYLAFTDYIKQFSDKVIIMSSFTAVIAPNSKICSILNRLRLIPEVLDTRSNSVIINKNKIAQKVANLKGCVFLDIQHEMELHKEFRRSDEIHYYKNGFNYVANRMADLILTE